MSVEHVVVLPLLLSLCTAVGLLFLARDAKRTAQVSVGSALLNVGIAFGMFGLVSQRGTLVLAMGGWAPPYGIVYVADAFAALLVCVVGIVALACLVFSRDKVCSPEPFPHAFVHFLLAGMYGALLTGDLFHLFVCFEVMLLASYALMTHGKTRKVVWRRAPFALNYAVINVVSSIFFLVSLAYVYGTLGTLNMAQLAQRLAMLHATGDTTGTVLAGLLLLTFSLKAGLVLSYWLPQAYRALTPPLAALFAGLMTKIGFVAIIRTMTLLFSHDQPMLERIGILGGVTMVIGIVGALLSKHIWHLWSYHIVMSIGFMAVALSTMHAVALTGMVWYLVHDMFGKTLLFLLGGMVVSVTQTTQLRQMGGRARVVASLAGWSLLVAVVVGGMPPFSGFIGKVLMLQGTILHAQYVLSGIALVASLVMVVTLFRVMRAAFWGSPEAMQRTDEPAHPPVRWAFGTVIALTILLLGMGVGAQGVLPSVARASQALVQPQQYIVDVLGETVHP